MLTVASLSTARLRYCLTGKLQLSAINIDPQIETMDWKEYEEITKYIYETLGNAAGTKIVGYGGTCKVKGKSGVSHQIDVLASHSDGVHNYRTAIECKYWDKKINKEIVMKIAEIVEDSGINKGVVVSKMGFTEDGISYAKSVVSGYKSKRIN